MSKRKPNPCLNCTKWKSLSVSTERKIGCKADTCPKLLKAVWDYDYTPKPTHGKHTT